MSSRRCALLAVLLSLFFAPLAVLHAQGYPSGKLSGRVTTSDGAALAGVVVTVTAPELQGSRTATTSGTGDYLFQALPPGDYTVAFVSQGLEPLTRQVRIAAAQSRQLDAQMAPTYTEEVSVVAGAGRLETISETPQGATTYTKELIDDLPAGRTLTQIVALAPGVQPNGPTKANETGLGNITVSGAPTYENLFLINGVVVNENLRGQAFDLFIEDAIQETTTAASGISAEYGRFSGGVVNVITRSGGNDFSGSLRTSFTNQKWTETTALTTSRNDEIVPTYEATLGGPVLRDRLWFFLAGRSRELEENRTTAAPTLVTYKNVRDQQRYEGKVTATVTPRHTLYGTYQKIEDSEDGNSFGTILDRDSLVDRETPQEAWSLSYTGSLTDSLLLSLQYAEREFSFIGSGAPTTDLIEGTLMLDRSRGNARYHSPTFCGVCKPEGRDNENLLAKLSYFLSTESLGSHDMLVGYDRFEDIRTADNHQSGSDYRVLGTSAIIRGEDIFPVFAADGSTIIQYNPIARGSEGTAFVTDSLYLNDTWRLSDRWSFNLGVRYDKNAGEDSAGQAVARDSKISPRLAASFDPKADGALSFHVGYAQYVAALANSIADSTSSAGQPITFQWLYRGPAVNTDPSGALLTTEQALQALFNWFTAANGGLPTQASPLGGGLVPVSGALIPGVNQRIRESLDSPSVTEYSLGASIRLGDRGVLRTDIVHRDWEDFYSARTDTSTGKVSGQIGNVTQTFDLTLLENNNKLYERTYDGLHTAFAYRPFDKLNLGGTWTYSQSKGNFNGENQGSGPLLGGLQNYPEYFDTRWSAPKGYLSIDQRHRVSLYGVYRVISGARHDLTASLLQSYYSGHPYEAVGAVNTRPYVTNPGYVTPPTSVSYFFSRRGAFTTPDIFRTDIALNYQIAIGSIDLFVKPEVINLFNEQRVDTTDVRYFNTTVLTANNAANCPNGPGGKCAPFNPFTEQPVEGVHWVKGSQFGKPINALGYQQPRTYRFSVGLRF